MRVEFGRSCAPSVLGRLGEVEVRIGRSQAVRSLDDALILGKNSSMTRLPIAVRADNSVVLDAALRYFQGRLIVDTDCPVEREMLEPIAAKYGAVVY